MHVSKILKKDNRIFIQENSLKISRKPTTPINNSSHHIPKSYNTSSYGTKQYNDSLQRSFNRAKQQIFFNPDMIYFVTLTYQSTDHTPTQVLHNLKTTLHNLRKKNKNLNPSNITHDNK